MSTLIGGVLFAFSLTGQTSDELQSVVVDVQVSIKNKNLAEARQQAQKSAFEKAVDQILPTTIDGVDRGIKLKQAAQYVKSFQVLEQKEEGPLLKVKYRCDVNVTAAVGQTPSPTELAQSEEQEFEIVWMPDQTQLNVSEVLKFVKEKMGLKVISFRVRRGSIRLSLPVQESAEKIQEQLTGFVGSKGLVKVLAKQNEVPSEVLVTPLPSGSPEGFEMPSFPGEEPLVPPVESPELYSPTPTAIETSPGL